MKSLLIIFICIFISNAGYSQDKRVKDTTQSDTAHYKLLRKVDINKPDSGSMNKNSTHNNKAKAKVMYRPTRLGSSSPLYGTYKKNDYGAGAITTNPNKSDPAIIYPISIYIDTIPTKITDSLKTEVKDSIPPTKN